MGDCGIHQTPAPVVGVRRALLSPNHQFLLVHGVEQVEVEAPRERLGVGDGGASSETVVRIESDVMRFTIKF